MRESILKQALDEVYDEEFAGFANHSEHKFSARHNRIMKRIFKLYKKNAVPVQEKNISTPKEKLNFHWNRRTVLVIIMLIFFAVLTGCAAAIYSLGGFRLSIHSDNTELFTVNTNNCPTIIF